LVDVERSSWNFLFDLSGMIKEKKKKQEIVKERTIERETERKRDIDRET
jgi:hypothetical protein